MVVKPAVIVPGQDNGATVPVRTLHHGVDETGYIPHAGLNISGRMLTIRHGRRKPADLRQGAVM